jgi:hypothetical protein
MAALEKVLVLEISGKIIELLPEKSGQSANGEWRKREYVLETEAQYPKKICFMAWGDKIDQFEIKKGERVTVSVDLESREYNGRWYTDVKAWKISRDGDVADNQSPMQNQGHYSSPGEDISTFDNSDIPF